LDGLLFEALKQRCPGRSYNEILEKLKGVLSFNDDYGVFHASSLTFGVSANTGFTAIDYCRADYLHSGKLSQRMFSGHGKNGKYPNIVIAGGPSKKRMTTRPAYCAPFAVFDALGDANQVTQLLSFFYIGIGYDTQNCGMGQFDVSNIEIINLPEDVSLIENGNAKRQLPLGIAAGHTGINRLLPPYFLKDEMVEVVTPPRVQVMNIDLI
jgi:hypothetical protein